MFMDGHSLEFRNAYSLDVSGTATENAIFRFLRFQCIGATENCGTFLFRATLGSAYDTVCDILVEPR